MLVLLLALTLILTSVIGCSPTAQEPGDDVSTRQLEMKHLQMILQTMTPKGLLRLIWNHMN